MDWLFILLGIAALVTALIVAVAYICFRMAFYASRKEVKPDYSIPDGDIYEPYREQMVGWMKELRTMPHEEISVTSFDGLTLRGKFYPHSPDAPIELMFHGYRGDSQRDLCGGVQRCFSLGHSALIVDQRGCGTSQGHVISFGVNERRDCLTWLEYMAQRFGPDARIILCGISMGAATVMMAAGETLPDTVIGVLADCGYTSAKEIIQKVIGEMHLPAKAAYPFVRLGARVFGGFCLEEQPPVEALRRCRIPVIFFHGECDDFVPCQMSRDNFEACAGRKRLVTVPGAGHGLCYLVDTEGYLAQLRSFFGQE